MAPITYSSLDSSAMYTIGWIAALHIERAAGEKMLDERHDTPKNFSQHPSDPNSYTWGRIAKHNIVIASLSAGSYGLVPAADTANGLRASLPHIRFGLLVGIGAGNPSTPRGEILLGDVAVSTPEGTIGGVVQHDSFKAKAANAKERIGFLNGPPPAILNALNALRAEHEAEDSRIEEYMEPFRSNKKMSVTYAYPGAINDALRRDRKGVRDSPLIHYGIIASGNELIKDSGRRDALIQLLRAESIEPICFEMEAAGLMKSFPCLVVRGICDYADVHKNDVWQRYAAATAAAFTKELLYYAKPIDVERAAKLEDLFQKVQDTRQSVADMREEMHEFAESTQFDTQLKVAGNAAYNAYAHHEYHSAVCLPETRVQILADIEDWSISPEQRPIYWLCGAAGIGKSTVARTIAYIFARDQKLGASFFFKRGEDNSGNAQRLYATLAKQLGVQNRRFRELVNEALKLDPDLCEKDLRTQFEALLLGPLKSLSEQSVSMNTGMMSAVAEREVQSQVSRLGKFILLDALDECENHSAIRHIIEDMAQLQHLNVRILITSRSELPIRLGFCKLDSMLYHDIRLEKLQESTIRHDIRLYLLHQFGKIRSDMQDRGIYGTIPVDWPGTESIETLTDLAVPLFITAATICRFIAQRDPVARLEKMLRQDRDLLSGLERTYQPILDQFLADAFDNGLDRTDIIANFKLIVGSIIQLQTPLSAQSLASILRITVPRILETLEPLHSVLSVPIDHISPIQTFHQSFRDYLIDPLKQDKTELWVDKTAVHFELYRRCIERLEQPDGLKKDMMNLGKPGAKRRDMSNGQIRSVIGDDVAYACTYWVYHLARCGFQISDEEDVYCFLRTHFLHWIETLGWLGQVSQALDNISTLLSCLNTSRCEQLRNFLYDAQSFIIEYRVLVDEAPLQLYSSALIFSPSKSVIKMCFQYEQDQVLAALPIVPSYWRALLFSFTGQASDVSAIAFSHDGQILASTSSDGTVRLWNTTTGQQTNAFMVSGHEVQKDATRPLGVRRRPPFVYAIAMAFSSDGQVLASAISDRTIRLWNLTTSEQFFVIAEHEAHITAVAFSPLLNSRKLAAASGRTVQLWDTFVGKHVLTFAGHTDRLGPIAYSPNGQLLASGSIDKTVRLWDVSLGTQVFKIQMQETVITVAFCPSTSMLLSAGRRTVRLWKFPSSPNLQNSREVLVPPYEQNTWERLLNAGFSTDGKAIAVFDGGQILDVSMGQLFPWDLGREVQAPAAFSRGGQFLATLAQDFRHTKIQLFNVTACEQPRHIELSNAATWRSSMSDGKKMDVDVVELNWQGLQIDENFQKQRHMPLRLNEEAVAVAFSPDQNLIAWMSFNDSIRLWDVTLGKVVHEFHALHALSTLTKVLQWLGAGVDYMSGEVQRGGFDTILAQERSYTGTVASTGSDSGIGHISPLEFSQDGSILCTQNGDFNVPERFLKNRNLIPSPPLIELDLRDSWLQHNGEDLLWLPPEYRGTCLARQGKMICIGSESGDVRFYYFT